MKKGFTLIEILVAMAIFLIIMLGASKMLNDIFINLNQGVLSLDSIDQARWSATEFTNEIRDAATGSDGSFPLNQAGDSQIIFYTNFGANGSMVERVRYYISGSALYKGITFPSGSPLVYNLSSESTSKVLGGVYNLNSPLFYYYDENYNGYSSPLAQPINLNQVRFVKMNLIITSQTTQNSTGTFSISSGAAIRNIKDNLGD